MIIADFLRALGQLGDPRFRRVLWLGIALSFALLVGIYAGLLFLIEMIEPGSVDIPGVGPVIDLRDLLGIGSFILMIFLSVFLMVPVASAITSLFLDDVAQAVEDRHYPHLPMLGHQSFWDALRDTVNFLGVIIAANIVAILFYVMLPFASPFIFYGMNGFLLGREYFTMAAMRREGRAGAIALRKRHGGTIWAAGILMTMPLSVPLLNLVVPILGAATFTHLYHRLAGTTRA